MFKIKDNVENTLVINKSKFITNIYKVKTEEEIYQILKSIKKEYYDATHNVYAYILDMGQKQKANDDGEPQGTAGKPMLEVLKNNDLTDVLAITTRYFGGIKLGASGLTRAYSNSVSEALTKAEILEITTKNVYSINLTYPTYNRIQDLLNKHTIIRQSFSDEVNLVLAIDTRLDNLFKQELKNLTLGKVVIEFLYEITE